MKQHPESELPPVWVRPPAGERHFALIFDRSPSGLSAFKEFSKTSTEMASPAARKSMTVFLSDDTHAYIGVWRTYGLTGGRTMFAPNVGSLVKALIPAIWEKVKEHGGDCAVGFYVEPSVQEICHARSAELSTVVSSGGTPVIETDSPELMAKLQSALHDDLAAMPDTVEDRFLAQLAELQSGAEKPVLFVGQRGYREVENLGVLSQIGSGLDSAIHDWLKGSDRFYVTLMDPSQTAGGFIPAADLAELTGGALQSMCSSFPSSCLDAVLLVCVSDLAEMEAITKAAHGHMGRAALDFIGSIGMPRADFPGAPYSAQASLDLFQLYVSRHPAYSLEERPLLDLIIGLLRKVSVYRLPEGGEFRIAEINARTSFDAKDINLPEPLMIVQFNVLDDLAGINDHATSPETMRRAVPPRLALLVDMRDPDAYKALPPGGFYALPAEFRANRQSLFVIPIDHGVLDTNKPSIDWSLGRFGYIFDLRSPVQFKVAHDSQGGTLFALGGRGLPLPLVKIGLDHVSAFEAEGLNPMEQMMGDVVTEAVAALQIATMPQHTFKLARDATDAHGRVFDLVGSYKKPN